MSCESIQRLLESLVDGEATPAEREQVAAHLETCPGCRDELERMRRLQLLVAQLPRRLEPGRDLWTGVLERIEHPAARERVVRWPGVWSRSLIAVAAAVLVLVGVAGILASRRGAVPSPPAVAPEDRAWPMLAGQDQRLAATRSQLLEHLAFREQTMSPVTLGSVNNGLEEIRRSMGGILDALDKNPGNPQLERLLARACRQELRLLQRAVLLPRQS